MINPVCEILLTPAPLAPPPPLFSAASGGVVDFYGVVRGTEESETISGIEYEAHAEMARHQLDLLCQEAFEKFPLHSLILHHRTGYIPTATPSLFLRTSAAHRGPAFAAAEWLIVQLKLRVPIWKHPLSQQTGEEVNRSLAEAGVVPTLTVLDRRTVRKGMNLPNRLTLGRLVLTVLFVAALSVDFPYHQTLALIFFVLAAATDYLDGEIARRYALVTDFGKLMDPLVDKIMTAAAFVCLVPLRAIPAWAAIIVIAREFLITGLRLLAVSKGRILAADPIGKHKTSWQIATVIFFLVLLAYTELPIHPTGVTGHGPVWDALWLYGGWTVSGIAVALTLYSGIDYLWRHRSMIDID